jgi:hypothetical protein
MPVALDWVKNEVAYSRRGSMTPKTMSGKVGSVVRAMVLVNVVDGCAWDETGKAGLRGRWRI